MSYEKNSLTRMPIWVKLPKLNVRYWGEKTLRIIVGYLGIVIKIDTATLNIDRMWYARVLVEIDINKGFPEELFYTNEYEELVAQQVEYEWIPLWCAECRTRLLKTTHQKNLNVDEHGFTPVKKKWVKKNRSQPKPKNDTMQTHISDTLISEQEGETCTYPPDNKDIGQEIREKTLSIAGQNRTLQGHIDISNGFELLQNLEENELI